MDLESASIVRRVVLVVEDEAMIRMMLVDAIEDAGLGVVEATNADDAITAFAQRKDIGVVVTDVRMPGSMDGIGLAGWMREHEPAIPVVICSGMDTRVDLRAINPAITNVVSKPYLPDDLAEIVAVLMRGTLR
ncbi:response regulator [Acidisoma cladoniae]|jgi:CheY-like chemotaxis protein|uniref:response regulator n=1 Tax=Acidisoma cladoniae TaxID=3040935 RepID=UPI0025518D8E|nr:response regulator [Acidisoma sp. PAMC 29798]